MCQNSKRAYCRSPGRSSRRKRTPLVSISTPCTNSSRVSRRPSLVTRCTDRLETRQWHSCSQLPVHTVVHTALNKCITNTASPKKPQFTVARPALPHPSRRPFAGECSSVDSYPSSSPPPSSAHFYSSPLFKIAPGNIYQKPLD